MHILSVRKLVFICVAFVSKGISSQLQWYLLKIPATWEAGAGGLLESSSLRGHPGNMAKTCLKTETKKLNHHHLYHTHCGSFFVFMLLPVSSTKENRDPNFPQRSEEPVSDSRGMAHYPRRTVILFPVRRTTHQGSNPGPLH